MNTGDGTPPRANDTRRYLVLALSYSSPPKYNHRGCGLCFIHGSRTKGKEAVRGVRRGEDELLHYV